MNKILMVFSSHHVLGDTGNTTGYSVSEAAHPYYVFQKAAIGVDFVSDMGGTPPAVVFPGEENDLQIISFLNDEKTKSKLAATPAASQVKADGYRGIFFVGGHGAMWDFPIATELARLATDIYDQGGVLAAVCHGPAALTNLRREDGSYLVAGKNVTSFSNEEENSLGLVDVMPFLLEDRLTQRGAHHTKAPAFQEHVVKDGRLLTGQNPASAAPLARLIVNEFGIVQGKVAAGGNLPLPS